MNPPAETEWNFFQTLKGNQNIEDYLEDEKIRADTVSAVEFDESGQYLAVGNRAGRIFVFERQGSKGNEKDKKEIIPIPSNNNNMKAPVVKDSNTGEYESLIVFRSHEAEFDCLKSLEIEEKINKVKWCKRQNGALFLLSTNDKTIKLWKISQKKAKPQIFKSKNLLSSSSNSSSSSYPSSPDSSMELSITPSSPSMEHVKFPALKETKSIAAATPRKVYANAHAYHVNSISLNSDGETFISSDDLRINLWNLNITNESFTIVDMKPPVMEDLTEVITSAEFHPQHCNLFIYSSSRGIIRLADMRQKALCDTQARTFEEPEDPSSKTFFSEMIASISDLKFSADGKFIISRDYMTIKLWDIAMEKKPVKTFHIHDYLRPRLCDLYDNDCIFDKFECAMSPNGNYLLTGSYHNHFYLFDRNSKNESRAEASSLAFMKKLPFKLKPPTKKLDFNPDIIDFNRKSLHVAWHPKDNIGAVGTENKVFLFRPSS